MPATLAAPDSMRPGLNRFAQVFESGYGSSIPKRDRKEQLIPMKQNSRWLKSGVAVVLAAFVLVVQAGLMAPESGYRPSS